MSRRPVRPDPHPGPRVQWVQRAKRSDAEDAVFLASSYGLIPDDWQTPIIDAWLSRRKNGKWTHRRCGLAVPRQNGKNGAIEVRELYGMVVLGEAFLHAAHEVKTTKKAFKRLKVFFGSQANDPDAAFPELNDLVREVRSTNGQEGIFLHDVCTTCRGPVPTCECGDERVTRRGGSIEFIARSGGSGRGFTVDVLVLDEAQHLSDDEIEAIRSTVSSAPLGNSQVIYAGTPPNTEKGQHGEVFLRIRAGVGKDKNLAWIEYGVPDGPLPDLDDVDLLFAVNPALGLRHGNGAYGLDMETVQGERGDLSDAGYARERLGWWGEKAGAARDVFGPGRWIGCGVSSDLAPPRVSAFGIGISLDTEWASIGAAGAWSDGRAHLAPVADETGTAKRGPHDGWIVAEALRLQQAHGCPVMLDEKCPDADLRETLTEAGVTVTLVSLDDYIETCSTLVKSVKARAVSHMHHPELDAAVAGARWRMVGDRKLFGRKQSDVEIDMLEACTHAYGGLLAELGYDVEDSLL